MYLLSSQATLTDCKFSNNESNGSLSGGAIHCFNATCECSTCIFSNCFGQEAGGIFLNGGHVAVDHCTFDGLNSVSHAAAIWVESGTAEVSNSIHCDDGSGSDYALRNVDQVTHSDFFGNSTSIQGGPPDFGILTQVNANGDSCDVYGNIFADPFFADPETGDFHLTWTSFPVWDETRSPCIDAGDPAFPLDPDGTTTDMGALFFDQRVPEIDVSATALEFGLVSVGGSGELPLVIYNVGNAALILYSIACSSPVFYTDWNLADTLIVPGDSLDITVTFAPDDTLVCEETLSIENNDTLASVLLSGQGTNPSHSPEVEGRPEHYALHSAFPNPCTRNTTIVYSLPQECPVELVVYSVLGEEVSTLVQQRMPAGTHKCTWCPDTYANGLYWYRLRAGEYRSAGKVIVMRR